MPNKPPHSKLPEGVVPSSVKVVQTSCLADGEMVCDEPLAENATVPKANYIDLCNRHV